MSDLWQMQGIGKSLGPIGDILSRLTPDYMPPVILRQQPVENILLRLLTPFPFAGDTHQPLRVLRGMPVENLYVTHFVNHPLIIVPEIIGQDPIFPRRYAVESQNVMVSIIPPVPPPVTPAAHLPLRIRKALLGRR